MKLGSEKPRLPKYIATHSPDAAFDLLWIKILKSDDGIRCYHCTWYPLLIPIHKSHSEEVMVTAPALPEDRIANLICFIIVILY
jgi:hypothetical protein